eukprot:g6774.t1
MHAYGGSSKNEHFVVTLVDKAMQSLSFFDLFYLCVYVLGVLNGEGVLIGGRKQCAKSGAKKPGVWTKWAGMGQELYIFLTSTWGCQTGGLERSKVKGVIPCPGGDVVLPPGVLASAGIDVPVVDLHVITAPNAFARTVQLRRLVRRRQMTQSASRQLLETEPEAPSGPDSVLVVSFTDPNGTELNVSNVGSLGSSSSSSSNNNNNNNRNDRNKSYSSSEKEEAVGSTSGSLWPILQHPEGAIELVMMHEPVTSLSTERVCRFWDEHAQAWSTDGCAFVPCKSNESVTVCACQHLTAFNVNFADFVPTVNLLSMSDLSNLKPSNIRRHPKGVIGLGVLYALLLAFLPFCLLRDTKENNLDERGKWVSKLQAKLKKEVTAKALAKESWRDNHRFLSMFIRPFGDNYTSFQRWCVISLELFVMLTVSAFFFGSSDQADWTIIVIAELVGILFGSLTEQVMMHCGELSYAEKIDYQAQLLLQAKKPEV